MTKGWKKPLLCELGTSIAEWPTPSPTPKPTHVPTATLSPTGKIYLPINTEKYIISPSSVGACRGNGGSSNKVNNKYKLGLTQAECETECDDITTCLGYAYQTGAGDAAEKYCLVYGPGVAGSCSNAFQDTQEKCEALGSCSDTSVDPCGESSSCLFIKEACENTGGIWTSTPGVWTEPGGGWTGMSHATTHIATGNGNPEYTCYDIDPDDHDATCTNGEDHAGYTVHGKYLECAAKWTDASKPGCVDIEGCPATPCNSDDSEAWCCETADCSGAWHYCGCERDFEANGKEDWACDRTAGCVYTGAPLVETVIRPHPGDALGCDNVYNNGMLGACRGTDQTTGGQVGVSSKWSRNCNIDGKQKDCGATGEPPCEMTQAECEAGCAAENAIAPGRCQAYHHMPGQQTPTGWVTGGWCSVFGPGVATGIGWDEAAGAAEPDSCWGYWETDSTHVDGTNANIMYMCWTVKDTTVNNVCVL